MATEQWTIRIDPKLDKRVRRAAERAGKSLNAYVVDSLEQLLEASNA